MARGDTPQILWEAGFAETLEFGYPLDRAVSWSEPREGTERVTAPSGSFDVWTTGEYELLRGMARWIPASDDTTPAGVPITGWDGSTGWAAFLSWARDGHLFRFVPDRDTPGTYVESYLREPLEGAPSLEDVDLTRRVSLVIYNADGNAYTGY